MSKVQGVILLDVVSFCEMPYTHCMFPFLTKNWSEVLLLAEALIPVGQLAWTERRNPWFSRVSRKVIVSVITCSTKLPDLVIALDFLIPVLQKCSRTYEPSYPKLPFSCVAALWTPLFLSEEVLCIYIYADWRAGEFGFRSMQREMICSCSAQPG